MQTTLELLDAVKSRYELPSDYALAKKLKIRASAISGYRHGRSSLAEEIALNVAEMLELDPGYVLACMEAERAQTDAARKVWARAADRLDALARREASGDCILCQIGDRGFPTLHPGALMAAMGSFYRPAHA